MREKACIFEGIGVNDFERNIMKSKFIIIEHAGTEVPLVFSPLLLHETVAENHNVTSAGFCGLDADGKWVVGGKSSSLKLNARPQDSKILNAHL